MPRRLAADVGPPTLADEATTSKEAMVKNVRTYTSRTKTGCMTCRRRRIKCDEAKPYCKRCVAGNRQCEGYAPQTNPTPALHMIIYTPATPSYPSTEPEKDSFQFFLAQSRTCFPAEFSRAVLQAAQIDHVFTHAIVSLGAAQQIYEYEDDPATRDRLGNLAMMQYGKALHLLQNPAHPCSTEILLLCCVLFACFESLRGCRRSAVVHIKSGLGLLRQSGGPEAKWSLVSWGTMTAIFTRLDNQIVEILGTSIHETVNESPTNKVYFPGPVTVKLPISALQISIDTHLNHLFHRQLRLALIVGGRVPTPEAPPTKEEISVSLGRQQALFKTEGLDTELLQIWQLMAQLYVKVEPGTGPEEAWDPFVKDFDTIVTLSDAYLTRERLQAKKRIFSFSIGVIPPLYTTATRCQDPHIRRRAVRLLAEYPRREVMWDSTVAAEVARKVMEIEEGSSGLASSSISDGPSEDKHARVRTVTAVLDDEGGGRFKFMQ